jgi:hypothetical protein
VRRLLNAKPAPCHFNDESLVEGFGACQRFDRALRGGFARNEAESRDRRQQQRDQNVIAGERNAEKTPRRDVALHDVDRLQLAQERTAGRETAQGPGAVGRTGPQVPFDAGVVAAEHDIADGGDEDDDKADHEQRCRRAAGRRDRHQQREWDDDVIGDALLEAKRAGRQSDDELEIPRAGKRGAGDREDRERRRGGRLGGNPADPGLFRHLRLRHRGFVAGIAAPRLRRGEQCADPEGGSKAIRKLGHPIDVRAGRIYRVGFMPVWRNW